MTDTTADKAVGAAIFAFIATIAGALLDGSFDILATGGLAISAAGAAGLAVYQIPYYRNRRPRRRRRRRAP